MKTTNTNRKTLKRVSIAALTATAVTLSILLPYSINKSKDIYTLCEDGDYYSETTYYSKESDYKDYINTKTDGVVTKTKTAKTTTDANLQETDNSEFVVAAVKSVWVAETKDENGKILENRLLNKAEIEKYNKSISNDGVNLLSSGTVIDPEPDDTITTSPTIVPPDPNVFLGSDSTEMYLLDIDMNVYHNTETNEYKITGNAYWEAKLVWASDSYKAAEEYILDYMGITWGGEGLRGNTPIMNGVYHDNTTVNTSRKASNAYAGYIWQFHEKSGWMGKEMKKGTAQVKLSKDGEIQNNYTCAKLTYIHTYQEETISSTIGITVAENPSLAASITSSVSKCSWQLEISVGGIIY